MKKSQEEKLATAIWVLSCNDDPPQMTYQSIEYRLEGSIESDIKKIIKKFPELFQEQIPKNHLQEWKSMMISEQLRPKWIAQNKNATEVINNLTLSDVFRNRFRNAVESTPVSPEILNWGLEYIKGYYGKVREKRDYYLRLVSLLFIPLLSLFVAFYSVNVSYKSSYKSLEFEEMKLKRELILPIYDRFATKFSNSLHKGIMQDSANDVIIELSEARSALFSLSPFLGSEKFDSLKQDFTEYQVALLEAQILDSIPHHKLDLISEKFANINIEVVKVVEGYFNEND
ncbi:hypothetical protein [Ekhidna sp.]|uniref:hypothetical protein n=1 Tax=Ekhidna sp. TaxID=2608089 RepID=UPI003516737A